MTARLGVVSDPGHKAATITGRCADMATARQVAESLQSQGVDEEAITLAGDPATEAAIEEQRRHRRETLAKEMLNAGLVGIMAGVLVGAPVAAAFSWFVFGSELGAFVPALLVGGLVVGGAGPLRVWREQRRERAAWERAQDRLRGRSTVSVVSDDPATLETAEAVLTDQTEEVSRQAGP
jgi:hypothetical protein